MVDRITTADASRVSGADFFEAINPGYRERIAARRQRDIEHCARLIESGQSTYGFPQWYVEQAERLIAEREQLTEVRGDPFLRSAAE